LKPILKKSFSKSFASTLCRLKALGFVAYRKRKGLLSLWEKSGDIAQKRYGSSMILNISGLLFLI
jgi:hypothetical protein